MKGVSEVIAIILILMIVIALAALAYTWFSGIFGTMTQTAGQNIQQTSQQMNAQFALESAKCSVLGCAGVDCVKVVIRNTGATTITMNKVTAYIAGVKFTATNPLPATITNGATGTFDVTLANLCTGATNAVGKTFKAVIDTGLEQTRTVE